MELYISDIAGSSLASLEYIPLTLYRAYALALVIWIWSGDIDLKGCATCPWSSLYEDRKSHDLISIGVSSIVKRAKELGVDIVFLHGGEPVSKPWLPSLIDGLKLHGIKLGIKVRAEMLEKQVNISSLQLVDAILIEIPSWISEDLLKKILRENISNILSKEDLYMELLLTDVYLEKQLAEKLVELSRFLEILPRTRQPVPIGLQAHGLEESKILSLISMISRTCSGICYVIESNTKISPEEIKCPRCGTIVARRKGIIVIPNKPDSKECPRCGIRIFSLEPHRARRTIPALSPIYIE
ncbi:MAG TPA: hypothetical protein VNL13_06370 [Sulfolobales archaeon]|nr:hypothetical protein [Sulfolobales archaeon]